MLASQGEWAACASRGQPKKKKIISRHRGYHGSTVISGSLTGLPLFHNYFDLPVDELLARLVGDLDALGRLDDARRALGVIGHRGRGMHQALLVHLLERQVARGLLGHDESPETKSYWCGRAGWRTGKSSPTQRKARRGA